jgi:large subunit ribosomal protein L32
MPNPKKKHSPMRRGMRRSANFRLTAASLSNCSNCGAAHMPHRICPSCGFYGGELVLPPKQKKKSEAN